MIRTNHNTGNGVIRNRKPIDNKAVDKIDETIIVNDNVLNVDMVSFKRGRSTGYDDSLPLRMFELAQIGLVQEQLALAFGISTCVLQKWMDKYPEFRNAYDNGKDIHDHSVQRTLLQRALGFEYPEVSQFDGTDSLGRPYSYTKTTKKRVLPDVTAIIFWLKNRHRGEWADVHRSEIRANVNLNLNKTLQLDKLNIEERAMVKEIAMKQISGMNGA